MKKVLLTIIDGFGYREEEKGNAVIKANPKILFRCGINILIQH